jgi:hypothetical protein
MAGSKLFDWLETEANKRDVQNSRYPIIWKKELCLRGECRAERTEHRWSIPFTSSVGLSSECYDCHKSKLIKIAKE